MTAKELNEALRNPSVKKTIEKIVDERLDYRKSKETANSKQAAKREKRG